MSKFDQLKRRTDEVRRDAYGNWDRLYAVLVPQIAAALAKPGRHVTCPFHGGANDFRVDRDYANDGKAICTCGRWDGFAMLMHANNWDFTTAVEEVAQVLGGSSSYRMSEPAQAAQRTSTAAQNRKDEKIKSTIKRWWSRTVPLSDPAARPARLYLKKRQLGQVMMPLDDLGFHPSLEYFDGEGNLVGNFPAIISIVRTVSGGVSTVHRTYLSVDGDKAPVDEPRKQYSSPKSNPVYGAAIRLDKQASPVLHVAEGLESALAVRAIVNSADPTWSTLNKALMQGLQVADHVKLVCIWADRDAKYGGQLSAIELMDTLRAMGKKAVVMLPPFEIPEGQKSIDWNDVVARLGLEATRNHFQVVKCMRGIEQARKTLEVGGSQAPGRRDAR